MIKTTIVFELVFHSHRWRKDILGVQEKIGWNVGFETTGVIGSGHRNTIMNLIQVLTEYQIKAVLAIGSRKLDLPADRLPYEAYGGQKEQAFACENLG